MPGCRWKMLVILSRRFFILLWSSWWFYWKRRTIPDPSTTDLPLCSLLRSINTVFGLDQTRETEAVEKRRKTIEGEGSGRIRSPILQGLCSARFHLYHICIYMNLILSTSSWLHLITPCIYMSRFHLSFLFIHVWSLIALSLL